MIAAKQTVISPRSLITGIFRFLQMDYYHFECSTQHCYQYIFSHFKEKEAELSFLRVTDLPLVCVVQNHDADSRFMMHNALYHKKMIFSLKIKEKMPLEKCVCLYWKIFTACSLLKTENDVNFVSAHRSHYAQIWMNGVDINSSTSVLSCLFLPFWRTLW